ncbi:MAG: biotin/lipoyl-binding protein, partial [Phycisphaerales bacterium]|nr:biotin/lipoyl-binding protein [Phycisphaerales bacterium]
MKMSSILVGIGVFVALGVVGGGLALVKYRQIQAGMNQPGFEPPEAVNLAAAKPLNWQPTSDLVGTVLSLRTVNVMNEVEGVVTMVGFKSGDIVDQGQMLVKLDDSTDRAELATAEAALRVAEAEISVKLADQKLAEDELRMQDAAAQSRATSNIEVSRARAEVERSGAEVIRA